MDPISRFAEAIADDALPGAGIIVACAGLLGGLAAKDTSVPSIRNELQPGCDPFDLDCYSTTVTETDPVSILGTGVPEWWAVMGGVPAGIIASVIACICVLPVALWARHRAAATAGSGEHPV